MDPSHALTNILQPQVQVRAWVISLAVVEKAGDAEKTHRVMIIRTVDLVLIFFVDFIFPPLLCHGTRWFFFSCDPEASQ
jgi:hypothetical protein